MSSTRRDNFFKSIADAGKNSSSSASTTIPKVPFMLQGTEDFNNYFVPRVVSIGPYHHPCGDNKKELKPAQALKLEFTNSFIDGKEGVKKVYDKILEDIMIKTLRECYDNEATSKYTNEELAEMFFLDGCSLLHYIHCYMHDSLNEWKIKDYHVAFVHQDLFLLENQLPFQVLKLLMNEKYGTTTPTAPTGTTLTAVPSTNQINIGMQMIENFIKKNIVTPGLEEQPWGQSQSSQPQQEEDRDPCHLLDLLRKRLVGIGNKKTTNNIVNTATNNRSDSTTQGYKWNSYRNVTELTAAGIKLQKSSTNRLTNVSFTPRFVHGYLKLPPIKVDDSTGPMFMNLIAYEMSPGISNGMEVTYFICFLDSLIDHQEDVKELRAAGILYNFLGSDENVAKLFNKISTDLVPNDEIYNKFKADIRKHYDNTYKTAMAEFVHTHFSTPWTLIGFIWALLTILFTAVTSISTLFPSKNECEGLCKQLKMRYI